MLDPQALLETVGTPGQIMDFTYRDINNATQLTTSA